MKKNIFTKLVLGVGLVVFALGVNYLYAWTAPTQAPPAGNVSAPINVGTTDQVKNAGLSVNAFSAFGNAYVQGTLGVGDVTPDGGLKLDVEGNVGASAYCDQNGVNCISAPFGSSGPDFESAWITMTYNAIGTVTHNLGTDRFSNFQFIVRESATKNDEIIIQGMQGGNYGYYAFNTTTGNVWSSDGITFFIDRSDGPTTKVKWYTAPNTGFGATYRSGSTFSATGMNWSGYSIGNAPPYTPATFEVKVRIWK